MEKLIDRGEQSFILGYPPKLPKDNDIINKSRGRKSFACIRGYIGTWEIICQDFFLKDIVGCYQLKVKNIQAKWFSDIIRVHIPGTKSLCLGDRSSPFFAKEKIVKIEKGVVQDFIVINTLEYKILTPPKLQYLSQWKLKGLGYYFGNLKELEILKEIKKNLQCIHDQAKDDQLKSMIECELYNFSEFFDRNGYSNHLSWNNKDELLVINNKPNT